MDSMISFGHLAMILKTYGPFGLLVVIWYFDIRQMRQLNMKYRDDMQRVLAKHKEFMREMRSMYDSNVRLVESYEDVATDLKDVVVLNTQAMTSIANKIDQNQFCPAQRVDKKQIEVG